MSCKTYSVRVPNKSSFLKLMAFFSYSIISFFTVFSILAATGCTPLPERLQKSEADIRYLPESKTPFVNYINQTKESIQRVRVDLTNDTELNETIIQANSPFQLTPDQSLCKHQNSPKQYNKGILLIHGLTGSPYTMQELGEFFRERCFLVRAILLPGHGTRPGDLLDIKLHDWVKSIEYGVQSFAGQVDEIFLAGYSLGGALAIHHILHEQHKKTTPSAIKGLFLFAPALKPNNNLAFLAGTASVFMDWDSITSDSNYAAYESFPYNAAAQTVNLINENNHLMEMGNEFPVPVFIVLSEDDATVDSKHTIAFFRKYMNKAPNQMQLYTKTPETYNHEHSIQALQSQLDQGKIVSFSHTSLLVPEQHAHYGYNGDYKRCLHYPEQSPEWLACKKDPTIAQAETSANFLKSQPIRQLTYNPYFDVMLKAMDRFLLALTLSTTVPDITRTE